MKGLLLLVILSLAALEGCAHSTMRGTVAMKINDEEAHVCMGEGEVKPGDAVALYENVCTAPRGPNRIGDGISSGGCTKKRLGEGRIVSILNSHYSLMKANPGSTFKEGTIVERQ